MKTSRKFVSLVCAMMMTVSMTACQQKPTSDSPSSQDVAAPSESRQSAAAESQPDTKYTLAISVPRISNPFFGRAVDVIQKAADEQGIELIVLDAEDNSAKQLTDIETMIGRKVDGIIMAPNDQDALVPGIEQLAKAKIPVVTVDRKVSEGEVLAHIGGDNRAGSAVAAEYIVKQLDGKGKVVQLEGQPGASVAKMRKEGFEEVISKSPDLVLISQPANFVRSEGMTVMETILRANPDVKAVFCHNEEMGLGAIEAIKAEGKQPGDIIVTCFDTHKETLAAIQEGWLQGNLEQFPDKQFLMGLEILMDYIKDGTMPASNEIYLKPVLITKDNLSESEKYGE